ncbi:MAG: hypothetical protein ABIS18_02425 [Actinomycetota bacterium]
MDDLRPAFYAASAGAWRDWWTLLHPPYTLWHLSYVAIGWALAPGGDVAKLVASLAAFFLAVGIASHALDELKGRPLQTNISDSALWTAAIVALAGAMSLGLIGVFGGATVLIPLIAMGAFAVVAYTLEIFGGMFHSDRAFGFFWGAFPLLTAYAAASGTVRPACIAASVWAYGLSLAQRGLSTPARRIRRKTRSIEGVITFTDGASETIQTDTILRPLEGALKALSWSVFALATALVWARLAL